MSISVHFSSITKIHQAYERGEISPLELTQEYLKEIKSSQLGAYLEICENRALDQAKQATRLLEGQKGKIPLDQMPLFGIPMGVKDLILVEGVRNTCGSKLMENYIAPYTATAVQLLESKGAITLGKLNLDEFGMGSSNENSAFYPARHPTHQDRVAGGSSGGSAAAVKARLCMVSLGTDTGGSIRLPASYCGIFGLKPSYGRVSRYGQVAYASSMDQIGPMTQCVEDAAIVLDAISGWDPKDITSLRLPSTQSLLALRKKWDWKDIKIGVPQEFFPETLDNEVRASLQKSMQWLESQGACLKKVSLPHAPYVVAAYYVIAMSEASSNLARFDGIRYGGQYSEMKSLEEFYQKARSKLGSEVKQRIMLGNFVLSHEYSQAFFERACRVRRKIKQDFEQIFQSVDFIIGPVCPTTAHFLEEAKDEPLKKYSDDTFTTPANLAGLPAMSITCGKDQQGLPIGMQWIAPALSDEKLICAAHAFEKRRLNDAL